MACVRRADRCPGLLRPHLAEDGALVRLRLPGGRTSAPALLGLHRLARRYGNGILQLTSRGGLQIRGLADPLADSFVAEVAGLGLLPSATHERVRNLVASPLTGLAGGAADLRPMITELDLALLAEPALARLPGRFLFALDDGRGDVSGLRFDLGYRATSTTEGHVLLGSPQHGIPVAAMDAVPPLVRLALDFVRVRQASGAWHVAELPDWVAQHAAGLEPLPAHRSVGGVPLGAVGSAASVQVPLGRLTEEQVRAIAAAASSGEVVLTPWRGVVVPGAAAALPDLAAAGLVTDEASGWTSITACVGAPCCGSAQIDTAALATELVAQAPWTGRVHLSGCSRRCGAPAGAYHDLVAPASTAQALHLLTQGAR